MEIVAPFAGAWIEILRFSIDDGTVNVAPFAGAWIEIPVSCADILLKFVAPFAGAWIEMALLSKNLVEVKSLPSRERGLK